MTKYEKGAKTIQRRASNNTLTLEQFKEKHYGKPGTDKREKLEAGYETFKLRELRLIGKERNLGLSM